ncbi:NUDIX hydrolase family protein [Bifidobacterium sp.]|jgi:ADP-ribose pyrophosphatase YjhB (NUDIX family)|uniref:NUDIX hydrolase family protein n=1 Tax=Bifidobacterium sp. TaxID=41200 RepID=UPI0025C4D707|nr:NUDIX hydrolase family protein [Bifidobacterium sp.]MCH4159770.1 NUDIX hydrolase family protein [Bifidobacterium sp.]MCH4174962.1 NUDIX hydrolase family protein [Bifidobacterium sp.]MCI1636295.1 NUDIX hydrolase family protein [Bifidobacterium sp.]
MRVLNDEVPDDDDFDAGRSRGEFDNITPEDFVRGSGSNPPGWLGPADIDRARHQLPIAYVEIVPVRSDELGRIVQIGSLLRMCEDGAIERTLITGRVLFHESLREAIARNVAKDLGELALPMIPSSLQPFTVAEFFPTPGVSEFHDPRQHAISLCYVIPVAGDCKPEDETLDVEWVSPSSPILEEFIKQMPDGHGKLLQRALSWAGLS